jgi:hypothetical protein
MKPEAIVPTDCRCGGTGEEWELDHKYFKAREALG